MQLNAMQSDYATWSTAILLSLLVHGMMFMQSGAQMGEENAPALQAPLITRLSFSQTADRSVLEKPRLPEKEPAKPVNKVEPKPVKNSQRIEQPQTVEKPESVRQMASLPMVQGQQVSDLSEGLLKAKRQQYLHRLLRHIESFKFYPRSARRRSTEGDVRISFVLRSDGSYEQLVLDGGQTILVRATREAMESAIPLPLPPEGVGMSRQIELSMVYSLAD